MKFSTVFQGLQEGHQPVPLPGAAVGHQASHWGWGQVKLRLGQAESALGSGTCGQAGESFGEMETAPVWHRKGGQGQQEQAVGLDTLRINCFICRKCSVREIAACALQKKKSMSRSELKPVGSAFHQ